MYMKSAKPWMMLSGILLMAVASIPEAWANTTTVDGIEWTYTVTNNEASLGGGYGHPSVPTSTVGCITIPSTLDGYRVTSIGNYAFHGCNGLAGIVIPNGVTSIGDHALYYCSGLTNISVAAGNPQYSSANGLLLNKNGTTVLLGVNGDVTIPDGVTRIEALAFYECRGLTSVTISEDVTRIGIWAFYPYLSEIYPHLSGGTSSFEGVF